VHFRPGDPGDLARAVEEVFANPTALARMRARTRAEFEARYTADENERQLIDIYRRVAEERRQAGSERTRSVYGTAH
jgi:glycosyltransferase involved in cell wall biosynthesis